MTPRDVTPDPSYRETPYSSPNNDSPLSKPTDSSIPNTVMNYRHVPTRSPLPGVQNNSTDVRLLLSGPSKTESVHVEFLAVIEDFRKKKSPMQHAVRSYDAKYISDFKVWKDEPKILGYVFEGPSVSSDQFNAAINWRMKSLETIIKIRQLMGWPIYRTELNRPCLCLVYLIEPEQLGICADAPKTKRAVLFMDLKECQFHPKNEHKIYVANLSDKPQ